MKLAFALYTLSVMGAYALTAWTGWEVGGSRKGLIPASVRQSPGGYRSYNYWRGGK